MKTGYITLATILLSGCSTTGVFNTYLDFSDVDHVQTAVCTDIALPPNSDTRLKKSFNYACGVRDTYREAMANRSRLRRGAVIPVLGLGATGVGLGLSGYDTTTILATALTGATIAGGTNLFDNRSNEIAYTLGSEAITCAMKAVLPLVTPADAREMAQFDSYLSASNDEGIEAKLATLRQAILKAEASARNDDFEDADVATVTSQISAARELIILTETTIKNARAMRTHRVQVPGALTSAVYSITDQVDTAIQQNSLSIDATVAVIKGLASSYQSFTAVPTEPAQTPLPATTGGGVPSADLPGPPIEPTTSIDAAKTELSNIRSQSSDAENINRQLIGAADELDKEVQSLNLELTLAKSALSANKNSQIKFNEDLKVFKSSQHGNLRDILDLGSHDNGNQKDQANKDLVNHIDLLSNEIAEKRSEEILLTNRITDSQDNLEDVQSQRSEIAADRKVIEDRIKILKQEEANAKSRLADLISDHANALKEYKHTLELVARSQNDIDVQSSRLAGAASEVNKQRRLLADVVNSVVALKPTESLQACGVDPDSVVGALSVSPARLEFTKGKTGSQYVIINGGQAPFSASLTRGDDAVEVEKADPFSSSLSVYFDGTSEQRRDILIVDGRNTRIIVPVNVLAPVSEPDEDNADGGDVKRGLDPAKLSDRASASAANLASSNVPIDEFQRAVCIAGVDADGKWGPNSQSRYEVNRGVYGIPLDDDGIVTDAVVTSIGAKMSELNLTLDDLVCTDGNLTFPPKP